MNIEVAYVMWCTVHTCVCVFMIRGEILFDPTNTVHMLYNYTYVYCICMCICVCVYVVCENYLEFQFTQCLSTHVASECNTTVKE